MKKFKLLLILSLLTITHACVSTSEVTVTQDNQFPTVTGTNLHGDEKTLPDCLTQERTIVVVAFQRWQQTLCDKWYESISAYLADNEHAEYFEIPTIAKMNAFTRWFIYRGMRGGIPDETMRRRVVTLHIDKEPYKKALKIDSEDTVHTYVLDKQGTILCQIKGEWTQDKWQKAVKSLNITSK